MSSKDLFRKLVLGTFKGFPGRKDYKTGRMKEGEIVRKRGRQTEGNRYRQRKR